MSINNFVDFHIITTEGSDAQENAMFIFPKRHLTNQIHMENKWNARVIHWMETTV